MTELVEFLQKAESKFENAPVGMLFEQEQSFALQQFAGNSYLEDAARANPLSLLHAMSNVASIGLSLNPAKKQAYLVPRGGKVCLDPSYMGMCDLAIQSGTLEFVQAKAVYAEDTYLNNGVDDKPTHAFNAFKDRGEVVGFYCVAKTVKGAYLTNEMSKADTDAIMKRSEMGKKSKGPWATDYIQMALKSVIRQAFKTWPKTEKLDRMAQAIELSNQNEQFEPLVTSPDTGQYNEEQKKYFDSLITNSDAIGMHCFMTSIDQGIQASLYNSFEKGTITKFKSIVSKLQMEGHSKLKDIEIVVTEAMASQDDFAAWEVLEGMSQEVTDWLITNCDSEVAAFISYLHKEGAA